MKVPQVISIKLGKWMKIRDQNKYRQIFFAPSVRPTRLLFIIYGNRTGTPTTVGRLVVIFFLKKVMSSGAGGLWHVNLCYSVFFP